MTIRAILSVSLLLAIQGEVARAQTPIAGDVVVEVSPGRAVAAKVIEARARITRINAETRQIYVTGPSNNPYTITAGPDVRNFAQIKVGDDVVIRTVQSIALNLVKDGKQIVAAHDTTDSVRAAAGDRPGGAVAKQVEIIANVTKVDPVAKIVTLQGPENVVDLPVGDPEQLKLIKVGDQVRAVITEAVAISVEPVPATAR